jgi:hypothetical protein
MKIDYINNFPEEIIATKTLIQPDNEGWKQDDNIDGSCNNYLEPINRCKLNMVREHNGNTIVEYYELDNMGGTEGILEFFADELKELIDKKLILIV